MNPLLEIRLLPPKNRNKLISILETQNSWKSLIEIVPEGDNNPQPKFSTEHVRLIENASFLQKRTCSEIFLEEWGTMGRKRPNLLILHKLLQEAVLLRAADYIASLIGIEPAERPSTGPAAPISTSTALTVISSHPEENYSTTNSNCSDHTLKEEETCSQDCYTHPSVYLQDTLLVRNKTTCVDLNDDFIVFNFNQLSEATNNFSESNKLGAGAFGAVFSCLLNGVKVAVKKFNCEEEFHPQSQFLNEIKSLKRYKHENLLPLIGYSSDAHLCLVYEFMENGCLQNQLMIKDETKILQWHRRLKIAQGTAEGINYLHTAFETPLIHRDVKSANILLDAQFSPKLGDFGLVRSVSSGTSVQTTTAIGTSAYMAPEAFRGDISVKMDTFSYGVVLLELLTSMPPYDENREGCDLVTAIWDDEDQDIENLMDKAAGWKSKQAEEVYTLAKNCLLHKKTQRPTMTQVLETVKKLVADFDQ